MEDKVESSNLTSQFEELFAEVSPLERRGNDFLSLMRIRIILLCRKMDQMLTAKLSAESLYEES